jgi:hypothetical protein
MPDIALPPTPAPDQAWLSNHAKCGEAEAFAAIDRFAPTPSQAGLLKTILQSTLDCGGMDGGVCRMALQLPILVHFGIRGTPDATVHQLAAALTLLEAGIYTLDHIMDMEVEGALAELPRGALLLGAVCLISHLPNQVLLALPLDPAVTAALARQLADGLARIGAGQLEDIAASTLGITSSDAVEHAVIMKTGERRALFTTMAATLAGGTPAQVEAYADFGRALGIARQLRSDLVDLFGQQPSRDLASRVLTLPLVLYLEREDRGGVEDMQRLLDCAGQQQDVQRQVCDRLRDSGIMRQVLIRIEHQCRTALDRLDLVQPVQQAGALLRDLALSTSVATAR